MKEVGVLDRLVRFFSPSAAVKRERARLMLEVMSKHSRKYEGASTANRLKNWKTQSTSAEAEVLGGLVKLRDRSRDLIRNDPHMSKAVQVITGKTIGAGIIPAFYGKSDAQVRKLSQVFHQWADSQRCDFLKETTLYGLQTLAMGSVVSSGEVLVRRIKPKATTDARGNILIPLELQILESDHLDDKKSESLKTGGRIVQGVEFDAEGRKVAYWIFNKHPGDSDSKAQESVRVPESEIAHIYRKDRPSQIRGVPWSAPVLVKVKDFNDYEDAQLMKQKMSACFSAFVYDSDPSSELEEEADLAETVGPGRIDLLPPGKDIKFANPPSVDGYSDYANQVLRGIASGMGITFESLSGNFSQVNFSSGRMGWIETQPSIDSWRWNMFIPLFCNRVMEWFLEAAQLAGYRVDGLTWDWTPPAREFIDPGKEIEAIKDSVRIGLKSLSQAIREQGYDPKTVLEEKAADNAFLDKLGLKLDSDPRILTDFGMSQPVYGNQASKDDETSEADE